MKIIRKSVVDCRPVEGHETKEIDKVLRAFYGIVVREEIHVDGPYVEKPTVANEFPKIIWKGLNESGKTVGIFNFKISNSIGNVFPKTGRTCHDAPIVEFMRDTAARIEHKNGDQVFAGIFTFAIDQPGSICCGIFYSDVLDRSNPIHDKPASSVGNPVAFYRIPTKRLVNVGDDYGDPSIVPVRPPDTKPIAPARTTEIEFPEPMRYIDSKTIADLRSNVQALAAIVERIQNAS